MNPGIVYAASAYLCWGLFPLYFRALSEVPAFEVLVHRVLWSLVFLIGLLAARKQWAWLGASLKNPRLMAAFALSALLLSTNWVTYIWSVANHHVIDASLGYFITPLVNVLLGFSVLGERPRSAQWAAVGLAAAGVAWLTAQTGGVPWIALVLAGSFGVYGLLRKVATLGALEGLSLETMLLAPAALALLGWWTAQGQAHLVGHDLTVSLLLIGVGPITAIPLLMFAAGARRISMTTLGLLQYIGPSIQLALGVWLFGESFGQARMIGFALIWLALVIYSLDGWHTNRARAAQAASAQAASG